MKSAYELAMERLQKDSPSTAITDEQKAELAEIDSLYRSKIAEREVFLKGQIAKASAAGQYQDVEQLQEELARDLRRLQNECEAKKEKARAAR